VTGTVAAIVVVVGSVVPDACTMFVGGTKPMSGSVGASRSPEHAAMERSASRVASTGSEDRIRGSVVTSIRGRGMPRGRTYRTKYKGDRKEKAPYSA
jgi:hypothetical protein